MRPLSSLPFTLEVLGWTSSLSLVIVLNNQLASWVIACSGPLWPELSSLRIRTQTPRCGLNIVSPTVFVSFLLCLLSSCVYILQWIRIFPLVSFPPLQSFWCSVTQGPFESHFRHTRLGYIGLSVQSMSDSPQPLKLHVPKLMTIMRNPPCPLHTLWQWVRWHISRNIGQVIFREKSWNALKMWSAYYLTSFISCTACVN